jgi:hypothetical protein
MLPHALGSDPDAAYRRWAEPSPRTSTSPPCPAITRSVSIPQLSFVVGVFEQSHDRCQEEAEMQYMMLVCADEEIELAADEAANIGTETQAWVQEMDGRGVRLQGNQLASVQDATTIRVRHGEVLVADGPFAETKEHIAGFDILECADLDEAIEVAAKHPVARFGALELRPFHDG